MNILYHHRTLGDGAEGIHVSSMVEAFSSLGHNVKVAAIVGDKTNAQSSRARVIEQLRNRTPRSLYEIMEMGYNFAGYRLLMNHVNGWIPGFIYERYNMFNLSGLMAARRLKVPLVLEVNAPVAYERATYNGLVLKGIGSAFERFLFRSADLLLSVSTPLKDYMVGQGAAAEKVVVLPNGTEPAVFRPDTAARAKIRQQLGIPSQGIVIGFVGILRPWHGVEMLLSAFSQIRNLPTQLVLLIVGDGPSEVELKQLTHSLGIANRVVFTGRVRHLQVAEYVASFDIAVSPRATFYASPMKIVEYMATGIPVVAPDMPNVRDLISNGQNGVLFQEENTDALTKSLESLIVNPGRRATLGENARRAVVSFRTWRHNAQQVVDLVRRLTDETC